MKKRILEENQHLCGVKRDRGKIEAMCLWRISGKIPWRGYWIYRFESHSRGLGWWTNLWVICKYYSCNVNYGLTYVCQRRDNKVRDKEILGRKTENPIFRGKWPGQKKKFQQTGKANRSVQFYGTQKKRLLKTEGESEPKGQMNGLSLSRIRTENDSILVRAEAVSRFDVKRRWRDTIESAHVPNILIKNSAISYVKYTSKSFFFSKKNYNKVQSQKVSISFHKTKIELSQAFSSLCSYISLLWDFSSTFFR